jgi:hypothetical protein
MHPLKLNIEVYELLKNDSILASYVNGRIFPLVAQTGTTMPFLVYNRSGVSSTLTKDGRLDGEVQTSVDVVTASYAQGIDIAVRLDEVLSGEHITPGGRFETFVQDFSEAYGEDAFIQTIIFNHKIN